MSELDLDAIEAREREAWPERDDSNDDKDRLRASVNDVIPLVAEVRRLRNTVQLVRELTDPDACPIPETDEDARGTAGWRFAMEHVRAALDGGDPS